ncbi:MAG: transposase family protein, partial [Chlamydiia bacterium]|nr:transposase family protein [Chlamydiia bacterium]
MKKEETLAKNELLNNTIWVHFSSLQDARVQDNQRYEFKHLIIAIICGMICGANNVDSIVNYIESKIDWFREILG